MPRPRERMEARITSWFKHLQKPEKTERRVNRPFVTISRESGAYGTTIADLLAEYLLKHERRREASWAVFDKELIQKVVEEHQFPARFKGYFAETPTPFIEDTLEELFGLHPLQETLIRSISETILHLATLGYVILVGRGANIITRKLPNGTHMRLVGSFEKRVAHMKEFLSLTEKQAREYVIKEDHDRQAYIKRYFQKDISDVSLYDLIINTDTVPLEEAVIIIGDMVLRTQMRQVV
jgi:cytidylate kinase